MALKVCFDGMEGPCEMLLDLDQHIPNELTLLNHVAQGLFYEPDASKIFLRVLRRGDQVIDIGGNVGFFSMLAASLVGPTGRVLTFEPDQRNVARFKNNQAINGFNQISLIEQPALDSPRSVSFFVNHENSGGSALWDPSQYPGNAPAPDGQGPLFLEGTTIDAEVTRAGFDHVKLIKIDTEGADHMVLLGARQMLATQRVPFILCELHDFGMMKMGSDQASFRNYMKDLGYQSYLLYFNGELPQLIPFNTKISTKYICNILFSTEDAVGQYWMAHEHNPGDISAGKRFIGT